MVLSFPVDKELKIKSYKVLIATCICYIASVFVLVSFRVLFQFHNHALKIGLQPKSFVLMYTLQWR